MQVMIAFRTCLKNELQSLEVNWTYDDFEDVFMKVLNKHAPMKKKYVGGNNAPFYEPNVDQGINAQIKTEKQI